MALMRWIWSKLRDESGQVPAPFLTGRSEQETFLPEQKLTAFEDLRTTLDDPARGVGPIIQTLLQALQPSEERARRNLADEFRKAGAISDASRAVEGRRLEGDILRGRSTTAASALLQFLSPLIQGRVGALSGIPALSRGTAQNFGFPRGPSQQQLNQQSAQRARAGVGGITGGGGSAEANTAAARQQFLASQQALFPGTPQFSLGPTGQAQPAAPIPLGRAPSRGAVAFGPTEGARGQEGFGVPGFTGQGTVDQPFTQDIQGFEDFSQADQDFFFGR